MADPIMIVLDELDEDACVAALVEAALNGTNPRPSAA